MKKTLVALIVLNLCAVGATAQSDMIIKQRARNVANGNPPAGAPPATAPATAAPRPAPVATPPNAQQQHVAKLKADLASAHQAGKVTDEAKHEFAKDLLAVAQGSNKPSTNSLAALADSLLPALADSKVSRSSDERLVQKLVTIVNSRSLSSTRTQELADEAQTALTSAGVSADNAAKVAAALQSVAADVQQASR